MSVRPFRDIKRRKTKVVTVGNVKIGGDNPISVQSMTNTLTTNVKETIKQINEIHNEGADLVRVSCPDESSSKALKEIQPNFRLKNDLLLFNEKDVTTEKTGRYTGYGWVKNITLYKKALTDDEVSYLYLYPERGLGTKHIEDQSVKIKNLEKTVEALTTRLEALENKS